MAALSARLAAVLEGGYNLATLPGLVGAALAGFGGARMSIDPRVDIGHVHLKVADIDRALAF